MVGAPKMLAIKITFDNTRQQIFVYLCLSKYFLELSLFYVFGVADANFGVSFRVVSSVLKVFATN